MGRRLCHHGHGRWRSLGLRLLGGTAFDMSFEVLLHRMAVMLVACQADRFAHFLLHRHCTGIVTVVGKHSSTCYSPVKFLGGPECMQQFVIVSQPDQH
jgi:hypothetical protein